MPITRTPFSVTYYGIANESDAVLVPAQGAGTRIVVEKIQVSCLPSGGATGNVSVQIYFQSTVGASDIPGLLFLGLNHIVQNWTEYYGALTMPFTGRLRGKHRQLLAGGGDADLTSRPLLDNRPVRFATVGVSATLALTIIVHGFVESGEL